MFTQRDYHPPPAWVTSRHKVDRLGRVTEQNHLVRFRADEAGDLVPRALELFRGFIA